MSQATFLGSKNKASYKLFMMLLVAYHFNKANHISL